MPSDPFSLAQTHKKSRIVALAASAARWDDGSWAAVHKKSQIVALFPEMTKKGSFRMRSESRSTSRRLSDQALLETNTYHPFLSFSQAQQFATFCAFGSDFAAGFGGPSWMPQRVYGFSCEKRLRTTRKASKTILRATEDYAENPAHRRTPRKAKRFAPFKRQARIAFVLGARKR